MVPLSEEQLRFYRDNGYLVLPGLLPADLLDELSEEYDRLFQRKNQDKMESSWVGRDEDDRKSNSQYTVSSS